jgi:ribonuclease HII
MTSAVPKLRSALKRSAPTRKTEEALWEVGSRHVIGVDEVGRGAWAGWVSVGAVIAPRDRRIYKLRDSKMLTEDEREAMFDRVTDWAERWCVGHASAAECDELGMSDAQKLAAARALDGLGVQPDHVLIDGNWDFVERATTIKIVKGDAKSVSIAAASIIAKVTRDRMMRAEAEHYDRYNFAANKGYPCPQHKAALQAWGPSAIHRRSWVFMDHLPWTGIRRFVRPGSQGVLFDVNAPPEPAV